MASLPCPRCGNQETLGTFCKDCLRHLSPLVKEIKPAKLILCSNCDNVKLHSDWVRMPEDVAVRRALSPALKLGDGDVIAVEIGEVKLMRKPGVKKIATALAVVTAKDEQGNEYDEDYDVALAYEVTLCPRCSKKGTSYYEGILQVRNQTAAVHKAIQDYLKLKKPKGLRLAKEVPVGSGSDYYLSDQRSIGQLAKHLQSSFGGELKVSAQHFSYDHAAGKNLYRVNAYLEIPEFSKGDVISRDDKYYFILGVSSKVTAESLLYGSRESFPYQQGTSRKLPIYTTQVSNVHPLQVLHPKSFQSVTPTNSKYAPAELDVDDDVSVALDGEYLFLIPHTAATSQVKVKRKRHSQKRRTKDDDLVNEE